jgi:AraC-like DNA-binding protein
MKLFLPDILFVLIIFQLLFLSFFLFTQEKGNRISNIILGSFFLSIALNLLDVLLLMTGAYNRNPWLAGWGSCLPLLFGPFIYFYTQSVLKKDFAVSIKSNYHFLPFIILFFVTEIYFVSRPATEQKAWLLNITQHHIPGSVSIVSTLIFIQFLGYIIASFQLVSDYKKAANQHFSSRQQTDVSWLSSMILFFLLIIVITILNGLMAQTSLATYYLWVFNLIVAATLVFVLSVLLKALQKPDFFSFTKEGEDTLKPALLSGQAAIPADPVKAEKSALSQKILNYMESGKPYLEPELTLDQLASKLSIKPRILSQTINESLGQNFYDFINRFRIKEASRLLTNPPDEKITIQEIFYEVGFQSKSSFNTLFKKYTGLTPSEFRKKKED